MKTYYAKKQNKKPNKPLEPKIKHTLKAVTDLFMSSWCWIHY